MTRGRLASRLARVLLIPGVLVPTSASADVVVIAGPQITRTGTLDIVFSDDFTRQRSEVHHVLLGGARERTRLDFTSDPLLAAGTKLEACGRERDGSLVVLEHSVIPPHRARVGENVNLGEQKTVVLLVNSYENPVEPATKQEIWDRVFAEDNPYSVNNYFSEVSYGKAWLSGLVFGWYTLPLEEAILCTDYYAVLDAAVAAADPDVYFPDFLRLMILFPQAPCGWGGLGNSGLVWFETDDGDVQMSWSLYNSVQQFGGTSSYGGSAYHELGHNFGCSHANDWECGAVVIGGDCESVNYGDHFDAMGLAGAKGHFNAIHKEVAGWFDPAHVLATGGPGRYVIEPIETNTTGLKTLKIPAADGDTYYVEFRRPLGFDAHLLDFYPTDHDGAVVSMDHFASNGDSQLLDMTPHVDSGSLPQFWDSLVSVLNEGQSFADAVNEVSVTTLSVTEDHLVVCVPEVGCDVSPRVFPFTVVAEDPDTLIWGARQDVGYARGHLAAVDSYEFFDSGDLLQERQLDISMDSPGGGDGIWYLVRSSCCGLWQTALGAEPEREVRLP